MPDGEPSPSAKVASELLDGVSLYGNLFVRLLAMVIVFPIMIAAVVLLLTVFLPALYRRLMAPELRTKLLEIDVPVCIDCGYSLAGHDAAADRCPECARPIDDRVRAMMTTPEAESTPEVGPAPDDRITGA